MKHNASFPYSLLVSQGEEVTVGREDPDMPGWYWCKNFQGVEAWVPNTHMLIKDTLGQITEDYNSTELDAEVGEVVQYLGETLGWAECLNKKWVYGWIPLEKLEVLND